MDEAVGNSGKETAVAWPRYAQLEQLVESRSRSEGQRYSKVECNADRLVAKALDLVMLMDTATSGPEQETLSQLIEALKPTSQNLLQASDLDKIPGCMLLHWSVDASPDHSLQGHEYLLWLKDHLALYGVKNAVLAPGYAPSTGRTE